MRTRVESTNVPERPYTYCVPRSSAVTRPVAASSVNAFSGPAVSRTASLLALPYRSMTDAFTVIEFPILISVSLMSVRTPTAAPGVTVSRTESATPNSGARILTYVAPDTRPNRTLASTRPSTSVVSIATALDGAQREVVRGHTYVASSPTRATLVATCASNRMMMPLANLPSRPRTSAVNTCGTGASIVSVTAAARIARTPSTPSGGTIGLSCVQAAAATMAAKNPARAKRSVNACTFGSQKEQHTMMPTGKATSDKRYRPHQTFQLLPRRVCAASLWKGGGNEPTYHQTVRRCFFSRSAGSPMRAVSPA